MKRVLSGILFFVICLTSHCNGLCCTSSVRNACSILGLKPQCDSQIYCQGDLLHTVQMARIYPDSKTFVDMKLKAPPEVTLNKFNTWKKLHPNPTSADVQQFVNDNFDDVGSEFEDWIPSDHKNASDLQIMSKIKDPEYRDWVVRLNDMWVELGRKIKDEVKANPELYSIIPVDNPVIVPGGRFREFYYWDSYWVIMGLLHSEMYDTAKRMMENFLSMIERFGYVPNGGRIYYSQRSQPPLLTPMVREYYEATGDFAFVRKALPLLEKEFRYWDRNNVVYVNGHRLYRYIEKSCGPRPESYYEDVLTAQNCSKDIDKENLYSEIKAAASSGMDFSSRWYIENGTNQGNLEDMKTRSIVAVDLNAWMYNIAKDLADFHQKNGNSLQKTSMESKAKVIQSAIHHVLWDEDVGVWLDYDLINRKRRNYFVVSNFAPLYAGSYDSNRKQHYSDKVLRYIQANQLDDFVSLPNTLVESGQQWDFPNVWPPMQYIAIEGLDRLETDEAKKMALNWASRYIRSNFVGYSTKHCMFEKYSATVSGQYGGGGEYAIQTGFGWTNGVVFYLLNKYGNQLTSHGTTQF